MGNDQRLSVPGFSRKLSLLYIGMCLITAAVVWIWRHSSTHPESKPSTAAIAGKQQVELHSKDESSATAIPALFWANVSAACERPGRIVELVYSADGSKLAIATDMGGITILDTGTKSIVGELLAATVGNRFLTVWDLRKRMLRAQIDCGEKSSRGGPSIQSLAFAPDSGTLACAMSLSFGEARFLSTVFVLSLKGGKIQTVFQQPPAGKYVGRPVSLAFAPDGSYLAIGFWDAVALLALPTCEIRLSVRRENRSMYDRLTTSSSEPHLLATSTVPGNVLVFDPQSGGLRADLAASARGRSSQCFTTLAFSPDGKCLAGSTQENYVYLWNSSSWRLIAEINEGVGSARSSGSCYMVFSSDSNSFLTASRNHDMSKIFARRRSSTDGELLAQVELLPSSIVPTHFQYPRVFSPNERELLAVATPPQNFDVEAPKRSSDECDDREFLIAYDISGLIRNPIRKRFDVGGSAKEQR